MQNNKKLYVGNLPWTIRTEELRNLFVEFGEIVDVIVLTDKYTGKSKGFGFVEFATEEMAKAAMDATNGKDIEGRKIIVNVAKPAPARE